jgi:hypothetical protein
VLICVKNDKESIIIRKSPEHAAAKASHPAQYTEHNSQCQPGGCSDNLDKESRASFPADLPNAQSRVSAYPPEEMRQSM